MSFTPRAAAAAPLLISLLLAGAPALAQTSPVPVAAPVLKFYGLIDLGVEYVTNASTGGDAVFRVPALTGEYPSRLGVRGEIPLLESIKGLFVAEAGFNANDGTSGQGGRLLGRQLWVGAATPYGQVSIGRQYTASFHALLDADVIGPAVYSLASLDNYLANARSDNTLAYRYDASGLGVLATYSGGRDKVGGTPGMGTCAGQTSTDANACRQWSALLRYSAPTFGAVAAVDVQYGGTGATDSFFNGAAALAFADSADRDQRRHLNAWAKAGELKLAGGWLGREVTAGATQVKSTLLYAGASYALASGWTFDAQAARLENADQSADARLWLARATRKLTPAWAVYSQLGRVENIGKAQYQLSAGGGGTLPAKGEAQNGVMLGSSYSF